MSAVGQRIRGRVAGVGGIVLISAAVAGCTSFATTSASSPAAATGSACAPLQTGAPPAWARGGFSGDSYPPFATSSSGNLVALVFGDPLSAPPASTHNNKILWVDRGGARTMDGTARVAGGDGVERLTLDVGPSIVDMPAAGCWHLDLRVGDRHDSIDLRWTTG